MKDKLITICYTADQDFLKSLTDQLDNLELMKKDEEGSQDSEDGHSIKYFDYKKRLVFWAMIHSNQKSYLIRATKDLFESRENKNYAELPHCNLILDEVTRYEKGEEKTLYEIIEEYKNDENLLLHSFEDYQLGIKYFKKIVKEN